MLAVTPQMRVLVAIDPVDFRRGIDGLAQVVRELFAADPFSGCVFVFGNRAKTAVKLLVYDGQGYWLCHKRLSANRFRHWPSRLTNESGRALMAHELTVLLRAGDFEKVSAAAEWRTVQPS